MIASARRQATLVATTKNATILGAACILGLALASCASGPRLYPAAPTLLPGVTAEMNGPGYWIARHPAPDELIMGETEIAAFNAGLRERGLTHDLWDALPTGPALAREMEAAARWFSAAGYYTAKGARVNEAFVEPIRRLMAIDALPAYPEPRFAFLSERTGLRALPSAEPLLDAPGDWYTDNLLASSLEPGLPLVVLHDSADGRWSYVRAERASGWVPAEALVPADAETFAAGRDRAGVLVVAARAELFEDPTCTRYALFVRMGTRLWSAPTEAATGMGSGGTARPVVLPARDATGAYAERILWVAADAVRDRPLPYTPRAVITQAFRLLNAPYGWGGDFGERDCSQFLCEIFATVGLVLPRNSSAQAKAGLPTEGFVAGATDEAKRPALAPCVPGATDIRLPGHIMLYLGESDGEPFVIHSTFAYKEPGFARDRWRLINRVAVSGLNLGAGTKRGSHLSRATNAQVLRVPPEADAP